MVPSKDLFDLIHSLTRTEKAYFKKFVFNHSTAGDSDYVKLFDVVERQKEYEEEAIKKHFRNENFIKQLSVTKNYLHRLILRSLNAYHADNSVNAKLYELLQSAENLMDKGLYRQAAKILSKAKEIASVSEKFPFLFLIEGLNRSVMNQTGLSVKKHELLIEDLDNEMLTIERFKNLKQYEALYHQLAFLFNRYGTVTDNKYFSKIVQNPLYKNDKYALSKQAYRWYLSIHALYCGMMRDNKNALIYSKRIIEFYEKNIEMIKETPKNYISHLCDLLFSQTLIEKYDGVEHTFNKLIKFIEIPNTKVPNDYKIKKIIASYGAITNFFMVEGSFAEGIQFISEHQSKLDVYFEQSDYTDRMMLCYNIAYCYFAIGEYHSTLKWLNKGLNDNIQQQRFDVQAHLRLMHFITHYELGNMEILESLANSANRYINKKIEFLRIETAIVNFIVKRLVGAVSKTKYAKALIEFKQELLTDYGMNAKDQAREMFDIFIWLDSKIEKRSYAEVLKRVISSEKSKRPNVEL